MANRVFETSAVQLPKLDAKLFSSQGLVVNVAGVLSAAGWDKVAAKASLRIAVIRGAVQSSRTGAIQDPAGSAVGSPAKPVNAGAGGASGAIYAKYPDLEPIPAMQQGASVFNTSTGPGCRVLHTYSPMLSGDPGDPDACRSALERIANAYAAAMEATLQPPANVAAGCDTTLLNLSPISGNIFAGPFKAGGYGDPTVTHLHPSYTLTAIALAQAALASAGRTTLRLAVYYFDPSVEAQAAPLLDEIYGPAGG